MFLLLIILPNARVPSNALLLSNIVCACRVVAAVQALSITSLTIGKRP
jgi:hypothetical protein